MRVLLSWIGMNDPWGRMRSSVPEGERPTGPILTLLRHQPFDHAYFLYDAHEEKRETDLATAISERYPKLNVDWVAVELEDPRDYHTIYHSVRALCQKVQHHHGAQAEYGVLLSPGTPQMHAVWILLVQTEIFPAKTYQTTERLHHQEVEEVTIPFSLKLDVLLPVEEEKTELLLSVDYIKAIRNTSFANIVHRSEVMKHRIESARRAAHSDFSILLTGDTGVGKDLFAKAIHESSHRANGPYISVNCGVIPDNLAESELFGHERGAFTGAVSTRKGLFEQANKGTIFLDEIGDLPYHLQVKLLRVLDNFRIRRVGGEKEISIDVRVISATRQNLQEEISAKRFREDLFYRLRTVHIEIPRLASRREDINDLIDTFFAHAKKNVQIPDADRISLSSSARRALMKYSWPGNVRELKRTVESLVAMTRTVIIEEGQVKEALNLNTPHDALEVLSSVELASSFSAERFCQEVEKRFIERGLKETSSLAAAARLLGYRSYQTLKRRMVEYGIAS